MFEYSDRNAILVFDQDVNDHVVRVALRIKGDGHMPVRYFFTGRKDHFFDFEKYVHYSSPIRFKGKKISGLRSSNMMTSRGCPYHCYYCSIAIFWRSCKFRSVTNVVDEIEYDYKMFPYIKTVCMQKGVSGEFRKPKVEIIAGLKKTEITHHELGCKFKLDVSKIMWSKGNHAERQHMIHVAKPHEIVVDMFAT